MVRGKGNTGLGHNVRPMHSALLYFCSDFMCLDAVLNCFEYWESSIYILQSSTNTIPTNYIH